MNEELLQLAYNKIQTKASFEQFKNDFSKDENLQKLVYSKLNTQASFDQFKKDALGVNTPVKPKGVTTEQNTASQSASVNGGSLSASGDVRPRTFTGERKGLVKKPKTFLQQAEEEQRTRPKVGETIVPKTKFDKKVETEVKKQDKLAVQSATPVEKVKQGLTAPTVEKTEKEKIISQSEFEKERASNYNYKYDDYAFADISEQDLVKTSSIFKDVNKLNIDISDFARFLKNKTNFYNDSYDIRRGRYENPDIEYNANKLEYLRAQSNNDSYLQAYLNDRVKFLKTKLLTTKDAVSKQKIANEISSIGKDYGKYRATLFPDLTKEEERIRTRNSQLYNRAKSGKGNALYQTKETVENFFSGVGAPIEDLTQTITEKLDETLKSFDINVLDTAVKKGRFKSYYDKWNSSDGFDGVYGSGKEVKFGKDTYIVTENGSVIDADTGSSINSFTDKNTLDSIKALANKTEKTGSYFSGVSLTRQIANTAGQIIPQVLATKGLGGTTNLQFARNAAIVNATMLGSSSFNETVSELTSNGIPEKEAREYASEVAVYMSVIGAVSGAISPNKASSKIAGQEFKDQIIKNTITAYKNSGLTGASGAIKKALNGLPNALKEIGLESISETGTESGETFGQKQVNSVINEKLGERILDDKMTKDEAISIMLVSSLATLPTSVAGTSSELFGLDVKEQFNAASELNDEDLIKSVKNVVSTGQITAERGDELITQVRNYRNNKSKLPSDIKGKKAVDATQLIAERENLKQQRKNLDEVFHPEIDAKIENINNQLKTVLNQPETIEDTTGTGKSTQEFFGTVVKGGDERYTPSKSYEYEQEFTPEQDKFRKKYDDKKGNFDEHIATSIPTFRETQVKKGNAIIKMLEDVENPVVYDLGGSEGSWVKTITEESGGKIKTINLDPSPEMKEAFDKNKPENSEMSLEAFYSGWDDVPTHEPKEKADVVHESMMFQFIENKGDRKQYIDEVADKYLKEDGVFITEEKFKMNTDEEYTKNEKLKESHKNKYYTPEQQSLKSDEVLVGMKENQANFDQYVKELQDRFKYVKTYWKSGNFRGIIATNNESKLNSFLENLGDTSNSYTWKPFYSKEEKVKYKGNFDKDVKRITDASEETEDGHTFNLDGTTYDQGGLVIPVISKNMKQSELTSEKIQEFVDEHSDKIDGNAVKVGIYKFPNSDEVSIDLNIVAPTSMRDEAIAFGKDAGQESLFDLDTFENVKTGADGKNPKSFSSDEFKEIARKFSINEPNQTTTTEEATVPNQEGKNTGNDEVLSTSITKENFEGLNLSETLGLNTLSNVLEDWDNKLKDFSKDTLGVNLPVVVARGAIKAMKAAVSVSKTGADVLSAGINYVRNTDWYKNLNDSDKKDFEFKGILSYLTEIENKKVAENVVKSETVDNKKSTKATIRQNTGQTDTSPKVTISESKLLKEKFKNLQRGFKEGVKETKQMKRDFIEQVKSSIKGLGSFITEQDAKTILNQVANVNDKNIDKISEIIDNLVSRLENRANKAKVNKLAKMQRKAKVKARTKYGNAGEDINKLIKLPANQIPEAYFDRYFDLMQKLSKGEPVNFNEVSKLYSDLKTEIESFIDRKNNATKDKKEPDVDKVNEAKSNLKGKINFAKLSTPKNKLTDFEKRVLKSFFEIPDSYLDQLSLSKLNELNKALDYFISTGYMPNKVLSDFVMKYKSEQTASNIINKVGDVVLKPVLSITGMIDKIKNKGFTSDDFFKNIQNNMLHHIDSTIKGIKGTLFYDNIVHPITSNFNKSDSETNKIGREVAEKLNAASKSEGSGFKVNVRLQMFFRQREFESNPELRGDKVFSLDDHMLSMKENENSLDYTKDDLDLIYQLYDEIKGKSSDEMLDMMTKEEKDLIDYMDKKLKEQEISSRDYNNHLLGETLIYPKDYFPRKASFTDNNADEASEIKARLFGMTGATSVKADSSNQRTANKANPLDFNSVANFMTNIRQSNIEKNLAFPVKQTLMTISNLKKSNDKSMITLANALEKTVKNLIEAQLGKNPYSYDSKGEQLFNKFTRNSVTRMLVDPIRLIYDVIANYPTVYGAFIDKLPAIKKASSNITNEVSSEIYKNISSTQSERVGGTASSDYKNAMTTPISKTSNRKAKVSPIEGLVDLYKNNKLSDFSENTGNLYYQIADLPARHLWKYYLSEEFRNITGNEFDGKKYLSDKNYREEVQESLQKAATSADKKTANYFNTGASSEQKLKIQGTKNNFLTRVNNFLRSFTFNENRVFWDSLKGMTGFGNTTFDSKSEAMRAFFVINARGITYSYLGSVIGQYLVDFVTGDDEEEKEMIDKKALKRSIGQHAALIALGNKGMIANFIGMFIGEQINARIVEEEKGKYNPYEDNMFYVPNKKSKYTDFLNNLGAEGAAIKTVVDFGSVVFNIYEKIESGEEVTKEDLVRYKTARHSVSLVSQATGLPIDRLGRLAQKTLDKKYPYEKKNKPKKISDSTWGKY